MSKHLITDPNERLRLVHLCLRAGKRAKDNTAYQPAANFFLFATELLPLDAWDTHYSLVFDLYKQLAEAEYLRGNYAEAEALYPQIIARTKTVFEKIEVYLIKNNQFERQQRCIFLRILRLLRNNKILLRGYFTVYF